MPDGLGGATGGRDGHGDATGGKDVHGGATGGMDGHGGATGSMDGHVGATGSMDGNGDQLIKSLSSVINYVPDLVEGQSMVLLTFGVLVHL